MLEYARWKYWLVAIVLLISLIFALPNVFGDERALQIARKDRAPMDAAQLSHVEDVLKQHGVTYKNAALEKGNAIIRFDNDVEQLKARDVAKDENAGLAKDYVNAMMYASRSPSWLQALGLRAMPLGLDLRGGLYLLYQVDVDGAVAKLLDSYDQDIRRALRSDNLTFTDINTLTENSDIPNGIRVLLPPNTDQAQVRTSVKKVQPDLACRDANVAQGKAVDCVLTPQQVRERRDFAITSNITTLRNRVNALGVSEPIVQRQGLDRILVQLPGVQNSAEVKDLLGKVATLEYRMVDPRPVPANGRAPIGAKIYDRYDRGQYVGKVMLKREVIVTGDQLTDARSSSGQQGPEVSVTLNSAGGEEMLRNTRANLGKPMAVVFIEQRSETVNGPDGKPLLDDQGKPVTRNIKDEKVVSVATINGVFSNRFQTTGLTMNEAKDLSQLLRGGALTAPISIANEKTITATLGEENIEKGVMALVIGMAALFLFMVIYYQMFGIVADLVLLANVVVLTALLSMLSVALSLPGIAGIILTVGMAVDANVLIYERIREELRNGVSPQAAIRAGFDKAFSAIADSNVTTFIAGVVLFVFGTGAIKGFAIVLSLGILTSMFTSLMGSRALLTLLYGGKRKIAKLAIG
ncbi:MAG TPA: protein translocase subunit SecD [Steroidobacteraceae bacterium]|jgi:preprotein translocase subunit SecD|nr:protein translocase subunit SecD [Steroidobacteraceae bacterium]